MSLNKRPILTISLFYIIGIWSVYKDYNLILISAVVLFAIVLLFLLKNMNLVISGLCIIMFVLALWTTNMVINKYDDLNKYNYLGFNSEEKHGVLGMVIDEQQTDEYQRLTLKVSEVDDEETNFKMYLYVYEAEVFYTYGDTVYAITKLHEPQSARFKGDFDSRLYCLARGLRYMQSATGNMIEIIDKNNDFSISRLAYNIRKSALKSARDLLPKDEAALAQGMMMGDKSMLSDEMRGNFKASGMAHITALSGIHINIISLALFYIVSGVSRKRRVLDILIATGIIAFYLIMGYSPSVLRAVIMALLAVVGNFIWRRSDVFNALAFSALLILLFVPFALYDVAFQLSFMAVLGMAIFLKPFNIQMFKKSKVMLIMPTISVLLTTWIITAYAFNTINFTAIWTNVLVFPLYSVSLIGGYIMCILDAVFHPLAEIVSYSVYVPLMLINKIIDFSAHYASVYIRVSSPGYWEVAIYSTFLYLLYQIEVWVIKKWSEKHS